MTGDIAPPCAGFSLTKISENSAVFYGGYQPQNGSCMTDVYTVTVIDTNRVVSCLIISCTIIPWLCLALEENGDDTGAW